MGWELNRSLFRRLVKLYLLALPAEVLLVVSEVLDARWLRFSRDFDVLVAERIGTPDPVLEEAFMAVAVAALLWHLAASFGLLRFKQWARSGFWMSNVVLWILILLPPLAKPMYEWPAGEVLSAAFQGLFATILLLSYSRDHGGLWFGSPTQQLSETN